MLFIVSDAANAAMVKGTMSNNASARIMHGAWQKAADLGCTCVLTESRVAQSPQTGRPAESGIG